jgi:hypothetical protein
MKMPYESNQWTTVLSILIFIFGMVGSFVSFAFPCTSDLVLFSRIIFCLFLGIGISCLMSCALCDIFNLEFLTEDK